jgi:hypothetical protein
LFLVFQSPMTLGEPALHDAAAASRIAAQHVKTFIRFLRNNYYP